jgi:hypothetical protein
MHIIGGILLLIVALGVFFFVGATNVFDPILGSLGSSFGRNSTSTASNNSQYYQEVRIQFVSLGGAPGQPMAVSLAAKPVGEEGFILTGWSLKTDRGTYTIPRATNLYSPSVAGVPPEDIYLRTGGVVNMYSGKNPVSGQPQAIRSDLNEWRIWLNADFLAAPHGTVILRDAQGKVVDQKEY